MPTIPHLHFQLMTTPDQLATISVPFKINTKYPRRGAIICNNRP